MGRPGPFPPSVGPPSCISGRGRYHRALMDTNTDNGSDRARRRMDVKHVARLARLGLREEELRRMEEPLAKILEYVDQISGLDVDGIEPTAHAVEVQNVFRDDEPGEPQEVERTLANAPASNAGLFAVPRILE